MTNGVRIEWWMNPHDPTEYTVSIYEGSASEIGSMGLWLRDERHVHIGSTAVRLDKVRTGVGSRMFAEVRDRFPGVDTYTANAATDEGFAFLQTLTARNPDVKIRTIDART